MHLNSLLLFQTHAAPLFSSDLRVLEIGPDAFPSTYQKAVSDKPLQWDTLDRFPHPGLTYCTDHDYEFPIPDDHYDIVLAGSVLEHVRKPWRWLPELVRITRPNGLVITINPISWTYHEAPVDCWRAYAAGMEALYEDAGLLVETCWWGSLEAPNYRRYIPGNSREAQSWQRRIYYSLLGPFGFPVERAYDTVTIGRKPATP
jgi:SAM-dependent methyltransferase